VVHRGEYYASAESEPLLVLPVLHVHVLGIGLLRKVADDPAHLPGNTGRPAAVPFIERFRTDAAHHVDARDARIFLTERIRTSHAASPIGGHSLANDAPGHSARLD
jgi:hypothetical protein